MLSLCPSHFNRFHFCSNFVPVELYWDWTKSINNPSQETTNHLEKPMYNSIWDGKQDKVNCYITVSKIIHSQAQTSCKSFEQLVCVVVLAQFSSLVSEKSYARNPKTIWAASRENLSTGVCEQHRRRPACASTQSDQRLCYSLIGKYYFLTYYEQNFKC